MASDDGVKITVATARRVFEATRYIEQLYRVPSPQTRTTSEGSCAVLKITTATGRMSGATPDTTGRGIIQQLNSSGVYVDSSSTAYPLLNNTSNVFAVGAYVTCAACYGYWSILNVDKCSNIS